MIDVMTKHRHRRRGRGSEVIEGGELRQGLDRVDRIAQKGWHADLSKCQEKHQHGCKRDPWRNRWQGDPTKDARPTAHQSGRVLPSWVHGAQMGDGEQHDDRHECGEQYRCATIEPKERGRQELGRYRRQCMTDQPSLPEKGEPSRCDHIGR